MLLAFSGLSFAVHGLPGVPRRVQAPNAWDVKSTWTVAKASPFLFACPPGFPSFMFP